MAVNNNNNHHHEDNVMIEDVHWEHIYSQWKKTLTCRRCDARFCEVNNIGRWKCWQHAVDSIPEAASRWPCCNKRVMSYNKFSNGCVRADHTTLEVPFNDEHTIPIPSFMAPRVGVDRMEKGAAVVNGEALLSDGVRSLDPNGGEDEGDYDEIYVFRYDRESSKKLEPLNIVEFNRHYDTYYNE